MPGILELAQDIFQNRVRIAVPDYIGVREPQYTTAVGLIKYAYKNAKIQGETISATPVSWSEPRENTASQSTQQPKAKARKTTGRKSDIKIKKILWLLF